jgi:hypothetical protein
MSLLTTCKIPPWSGQCFELLIKEGHEGATLFHRFMNIYISSWLQSHNWQLVSLQVHLSGANPNSKNGIKELSSSNLRSGGTESGLRFWMTPPLLSDWCLHVILNARLLPNHSTVPNSLDHLKRHLSNCKQTEDTKFCGIISIMTGITYVHDTRRQPLIAKEKSQSENLARDSCGYCAWLVGIPCEM